MILEIGIMVGAYILVRLAPPGTLQKSLTALATVLIVLVLSDLLVRGFTEQSIAGLFQRTKDSASSESKAIPPTPSPNNEAPKVTRSNGGSIRTVLGYGLVVAKNSSLEREFIAVHQPALPVQLEGTPGVVTVYESGSGGNYRYRARFEVKPKEALSAVEVRFLVFDVWGNHVRSLRYTEVADLAANTSNTFDGKWDLYSENEVEQHYASIAYVARAKLKDGRVMVADDEPVIAEAKKFSAKFTAEDLEPKPAQRAALR